MQNPLTDPVGNKNSTLEDGSFKLPDESFNMEMMTCLSNADDTFRVYSFGHFNKENSLRFPFTLLMAQMVLIMISTRFVYYLLRPLKQPRFVCDIIGGILLSPDLLGSIRIKWEGQDSVLSNVLFPNDYYSMIHTLAAVGLMFYLFLIGVKMEPKMIFQSGRKAWAVGIVSLALPFLLVGSASYVLKDVLEMRIAKGRFLVFAVASVSITAFPVLADILAELHLLNSELGRLAMSSAMVHGVFGFFFMALFIALNQSQGGWEKAVWSMLSLTVIIVLVVFAFRPWMRWIIRKTPKGVRIEETHIFSIFISVIVMGIISDYIGASFVYGPLIMGLAVPEGPPLGAALVERAQLVAGEVMMPLLFAVSGIETEVTVIVQWRKWSIMLLMLTMGYIAKVVGTMVPAIYCKIPIHNAFLLGLMMNFRGLVEMITFLNFRNGALLGSESYTIMMLLSVLGTAISVPVVATFYKPLLNSYAVGRRTIQHLKPHAELRILACVQNENPIPSIINLLEASCPTEETPLCVYVLHLVELVGRSNSTLIAHKNKKGFINPSQMDRLHNVFINYEQNKKGYCAVQPFTTVTPYKTMNQDICSLAAEKNVALIVVPFRRRDSVSAMVDADQAIRSNIPEILAQAPCSVGILVHTSLMGPVSATTGHFQHHIGVLFWGGPDDREALAYASRMVHRTGVNLTIIHFMLAVDRRDMKQRQLDDDLLANIRFENTNNEHVVIDDVLVKDVEQTITVIRSIGNNYNLLIVGRKQGPNSLLDEGLAEWSDCPELGVVGDMLASNDFDSSSSIFVVQQQP